MAARLPRLILAVTAILVVVGCAPPPELHIGTRTYHPVPTTAPKDPEAYYTPPVTTIPPGDDVTDVNGNLLPDTTTSEST